MQLHTHSGGEHLLGLEPAGLKIFSSLMMSRKMQRNIKMQSSNKRRLHTGEQVINRMLEL